MGRGLCRSLPVQISIISLLSALSVSLQLHKLIIVNACATTNPSQSHSPPVAMASNPPSGASTPSGSTLGLRFTSQSKTTEDILSTQTVGLVALSDFSKRRAEAIEQKEKERDAATSRVSRGTRNGSDR